MNNKPRKLIKGKSVFEITRFGSYVDTSLYGIAQEKNATSYEELIKAGYRHLNMQIK